MFLYGPESGNNVTELSCYNSEEPDQSTPIVVKYTAQYRLINGVYVARDAEYVEYQSDGLITRRSKLSYSDITPCDPKKLTQRFTLADLKLKNGTRILNQGTGIRYYLDSAKKLEGTLLEQLEAQNGSTPKK